MTHSKIALLFGFRGATGLAFLLVLLCSGASFAQSKTIIDEWSSVQAPKPPELKSVKIDDPKSTAFLVLDIVKQNCNNERRPRCVASVPKIQAFLNQARACLLYTSPSPRDS